VKKLAWAFIIPLLSSCSDLAAVSDISSRLVSASSSWDDVASDIAGSCQREQTLNPELRDCQTEQSASDGMVGANALLRSYFQALGDAANESNFSIQPGLDTATSSVANIPGINTDQVQAASGLFAALARIATESMRESTIREWGPLGAKYDITMCTSCTAGRSATIRASTQRHPPCHASATPM